MRTSTFVSSEIVFSLLLAAASLILLGVVFLITYIVFKMRDDERLMRIFFITYIAMFAFALTTLLVAGLSFAFLTIDLKMVAAKGF